MGPKSERFVRGVVGGLQQNRALVPPGLGLEDALVDLQTLDIGE